MTRVYDLNRAITGSDQLADVQPPPPGVAALPVYAAPVPAGLSPRQIGPRSQRDSFLLSSCALMVKTTRGDVSPDHRRG